MEGWNVGILEARWTRELVYIEWFSVMTDGSNTI